MGDIQTLNRLIDILCIICIAFKCLELFTPILSPHLIDETCQDNIGTPVRYKKQNGATKGPTLPPSYKKISSLPSKIFVILPFDIDL